MIMFLLNLSPASCWHCRCLPGVSQDRAVPALVQPLGEQIQLESNWLSAGSRVGQLPAPSTAQLCISLLVP